MSLIDTFEAKKTLQIDDQKYIFYDLNVLSDRFNFDLNSIPCTLKILLENLIRNEDNISITKEMITNFCKDLNNLSKKNKEILFHPNRVLMNDYTGVPAIADLAAMRDALNNKNIEPNMINPLSRVDLIIDHSVTVDSFGKKDSFQKNVENEFSKNKERYEFLKW